jgi:hypothetical protein
MFKSSEMGIVRFACEVYIKLFKNHKIFRQYLLLSEIIIFGEGEGKYKEELQSINSRHTKVGN